VWGYICCAPYAFLACTGKTLQFLQFNLVIVFYVEFCLAFIWQGQVDGVCERCLRSVDYKYTWYMLCKRCYLGVSS
jgi:hypothetical protein